MSELFDRLSEFLAHRKGLLPLIGIVFIIINLFLQFFDLGWLTTSNIFLHVGLIIAILGLMLAWAL
ncbi:MAG: hypothetical protein HY258_10875 [Chloroflexi bacterium]|nr:hypothetical protein [Chloroflexota bacterium]